MCAAKPYRLLHGNQSNIDRSIFDVKRFPQTSSSRSSPKPLDQIRNALRCTYSPLHTEKASIRRGAASFTFTRGSRRLAPEPGAQRLALSVLRDPRLTWTPISRFPCEMFRVLSITQRRESAKVWTVKKLVGVILFEITQRRKGLDSAKVKGGRQTSLPS